MRSPTAVRSVAPVAHLGGALAVGAVVAADPGGWYPFGPTKWLVVSTSVAAMAAVAAWSGVRPRLRRPIVVAGSALLVWLAFAALVGRDPLYAWTGTPERHLGVVAWVLFAVCAVVGSTLGRGELALIARWCVAATWVCAGYAGVEWWWRRPIEIGSESSRLGGPFGSAAYLGAALCLLLPVCVGIALARDESRGWRWAGGGAAVAGTAVALGTGSRAALIGLVVAAVVAAVRLRPSRRVVFVAAAVCAGALGAVGPRLDDVFDRSLPASSRVDEWSMAVRAVAERPLFGAGPEGYRTVLADAVTVDYERTYGRDVLPDRAHSAPLDVAVIAGVPGLLAYLALVLLVVRHGWRAIRRHDPTAAFGVAALAYLTQQLFLFPLAELDPLLWLFAGAVVGTQNASRSVSDPLRDTPHATTLSGSPGVGLTHSGIVAGIAALAALVLFVTGVLGVAADRAARRSLTERGAAALASAERAADLRPDVIRYHLLVASRATALGTVAGVQAAIVAADRAVDVSPHDPVARRAAAQARLDLARATGRAADVTAAVDAWRALVDDDPRCRACQYGFGIAAALSSDTDAADVAWSAATELSRVGDTRAADALAALRAIEGTSP